MKRLFVTLSLWVLGMAGLQAEPLRFAPLPMQEPERVFREVYPMLQYLEAETDLSFRIVYTSSYQDLLERMAAGEVDLTYLGPLPYLQLTDQYTQVSPLVVFREPNGKTTYTCSLVAFAGAPLDGKHRQQPVALTQPRSTCGFLAVHSLLTSQGISLHQAGYCYLGQHDQVALSVIRGDFVWGGMKTQIARQYQHLGLSLELESEPFPGFALVANEQTLSKEDQLQLKQALLRLDPQSNPDAAARVASWGEQYRYGVAPIADQDYQSLRQLREGVVIPEECRLP